MSVIQNNIVKLNIGSGYILSSIIFTPLLVGKGIAWGAVLAKVLASVVAGNTANAIDALIDDSTGDEGISVENQDLNKAVGKAIAAVIVLAAKRYQGATHNNLMKIADYAQNNWVEIAQQELTQETYPQLREANLDQFLTPDEYKLTQDGNFNEEDWQAIFIRLTIATCPKDRIVFNDTVKQKVANLLHTTFPKALRETLKEDFAKHGEAFAGLTLQLPRGMQLQLSQLQAGQGISVENQDLNKAVGKAIAAVIVLAAKRYQGATHNNLMKIADCAQNNWVEIAQQELTQQRYPDREEAQLGQFFTPAEYQLTLQDNLTTTEWDDIFIRLNMAACKGGGFPIPRQVRQQVAELLHTTFPNALRETLKEDFAKDGKAWAGLTLQLLTGMQLQLSQLQASQGEVNIGESSQNLQQFQEVETQLRGSATQQQAFFRNVSHDIESGFAEVCQRLGVMETTITELLPTPEEGLVELHKEVLQGLEALHDQPGGRSLSKQEYRNRQNILTQMRTEVESRLTQSIHRAAF
ncbi:MAG: hypothetical protein ACRCU2_09280, partial [Planktothrix sp.]